MEDDLVAITQGLKKRWQSSVDRQRIHVLSSDSASIIQLPAARSQPWAENQGLLVTIRQLKQAFELWTNAAISPASQTLIEAENAKTSQYTVVCRQGPELLDMVANSGNKPLLKTYRQHFSNHPLAVAARRKNKVSAEPSES
ncbi:hypothetical protein [Pseudomonas syringae group genomosp. 3]|uniref:hypothetical protein n=1 Tax=Pseudomonas syringae group genomosp. 3 TaxID=251701 RepID=UPI001C8091C9|nr:hypothetical protein [Pseudomonas syringae group genomosp. 3]